MAEIVLGLGGAILSPIVQVLFDRMASLKAFEFGQWKPSDEVLKKLKTPLLLINAVLNDAEEKQITNPAVKEWVIELKDVAYDAEDVLDEIATDAECKLEGDLQVSRNKVPPLILTSLLFCNIHLYITKN